MQCCQAMNPLPPCIMHQRSVCCVGRARVILSHVQLVVVTTPRSSSDVILPSHATHCVHVYPFFSSLNECLAFLFAKGHLVPLGSALPSPSRSDCSLVRHPGRQHRSLTLVSSINFISCLLIPSSRLLLKMLNIMDSKFDNAGLCWLLLSSLRQSD